MVAAFKSNVLGREDIIRKPMALAVSCDNPDDSCTRTPPGRSYQPADPLLTSPYLVVAFCAPICEFPNQGRGLSEGGR